MMKNIQYKIILLRHAESEKNIKKIHGGQGEALTLLGLEQAKNIARVLEKKTDIDKLKIYTSTSFHTQATANVISAELNIPVEVPLLFKPLYLGIADGKSEFELMEKHPEIQALFDSWRKREIDIKKLIVPEMESYMNFWHRGEKLLKQVLSDKDVLMVCSNSLMILLANFMLGNHPLNTDEYKHITIKNCDMITFSTNDLKNFTLYSDLTTLDIGR